jgi:hypothetical protein
VIWSTQDSKSVDMEDVEQKQATSNRAATRWKTIK